MVEQPTQPTVFKQPGGVPKPAFKPKQPEVIALISPETSPETKKPRKAVPTPPPAAPSMQGFVEYAQQRQAEASTTNTKLRREKLETVITSHAGKSSVQASVNAVRQEFGANVPECCEFVGQLLERYLLVTGSLATQTQKSMVLGHLQQVQRELERAPHRPTGTFKNSFVPGYRAGLGAGLTETAAKTLPSCTGGEPPQETFLAAMLAESGALRGVQRHQHDRADRKAQHAANSHPATKYTPSKFLAAQVEPGSFERHEGTLRSKMRVLTAWVGHSDDEIHPDKLTWQLAEQFEHPKGPYRAYESTLLDPFKLEVLASPEGASRGWPFKRINGQNDKFVWVLPSLSSALKTHIRCHETVKQRINYD